MTRELALTALLVLLAVFTILGNIALAAGLSPEYRGVVFLAIALQTWVLIAVTSAIGRVWGLRDQVPDCE